MQQGIPLLLAFAIYTVKRQTLKERKIGGFGE